MKKRKQFYFAAISAAIFAFLTFSCSLDIKTDSPLSLFPLSSVNLLESPFLQASKINENYVLAHEPDRLLAPFLSEAGLPAIAEKYGSWESTGLDGHSAGHFLSALSMMAVSSGNTEAIGRLNYMVDQLALCQQANANGYVGGIPGGKAVWEDIAAGKIEAESFSLNGKWVPWYNLHKLFAGLRDAWLIAGNEQARVVLINLSEWCNELCNKLNESQMQEMLKTEHGGMNEVLADVYVITGDKKFLELARKFSHRFILDPLLESADHLTGLHANTQIPKVIGFMRIAGVENDTAWANAADFFWERVTHHRSVAIGGNSVREHFNPKDDFSSMIEFPEGPETCNSYNMLKLTKLLFLRNQDPKYIDYYERTLYNHILSSQHPEHGGLVYLTPMRPGHYRVYSKAEESFWCCVGSGIENHAKYGEMIYANDGTNLYVNLFIPSVLDWKEKGIKANQSTRFPDSGESTISLEMDAPLNFGIQLRVPSWAKTDEMIVSVNGRTIMNKSKPGEYLNINRKWKDGDTIRVGFKMHVYGEYLPDNSPWMALLYGPLVLAAPFGKNEMEGLVADGAGWDQIARGPLTPPEKIPSLKISDPNCAELIKPVGNNDIVFDISGLLANTADTIPDLIPFYRLHDSRYIIYWPVQ